MFLVSPDLPNVLSAFPMFLVSPKWLAETSPSPEILWRRSRWSQKKIVLSFAASERELAPKTKNVARKLFICALVAQKNIRSVNPQNAFFHDLRIPKTKKGSKELLKGSQRFP